MKFQTFITFLIFLFGLISPSQNNSICGELEYKVSITIAYDYEEYYKLRFNDSISLAVEINIEKSKAKLVKEKENEMQTNKIINGRKNETPAFYFNDVENFYFSEIWDDDIIFVKEDSFSWEWQLYSETKKIGSFTCQKATIEYRGRNYTAWFTNEIPVRFGPWKFQGLPGLILEVYDDDFYLHITTNKIAIDNKDCIINFDNKKLVKALSIKDYLKKRKELTKAKFARISSKLPKGSKPLVLDETCEGCDSGRIEIFND